MQEHQHDGHDLLEFVEHVAGDAYMRVEEDLGGGFVRLNVIEAERRQAKHDIQSVEDIVIELLRNSRDAGAKTLFVALTKDAAGYRYINAVDDGAGIPSAFSGLIFEPRVTTKLDHLTEDRYGIHGRGMALYAIKQRAETIDLVYSSPNQGTSFRVIIDVSSLRERNDQSTYPTLEIDDNGNPVCKGIHNIPRIVVEFAMDTPDISIYLGSPTEILATMRAMSTNEDHAAAIIRAGRDSVSRPLWSLAGSARDVKSLATLADRFFGLQISDRNLYRIISNEITSLEAIRPGNYRNVLKRQSIKSSCKKLSENSSRLLQDADIEYVAIQSMRALNVVAAKYFLRAQRKPEVKREGDKLKISLFIEKTE